MAGGEARAGPEGLQFVPGEKTIVFVILVAQVLIYSWTASTINEIKDRVSKRHIPSCLSEKPLLYLFRNFPKNVKTGWRG